jgi:hypothetical protein
MTDILLLKNFYALFRQNPERAVLDAEAAVSAADVLCQGR